MNKVDEMWLRVGHLSKKRVLPPETELAAVMLHTELQGFAWDDIVGTCRLAHFVEVRHMCMYYLRQAGLTYTSIGRMMNRDHATCVHANKKLGGYMDVDYHFRNRYIDFAHGIEKSKEAITGS
jgi:chromosomal replication initiation ATPase DnaA